jgi:hypothetical protein
VKREGIVQTKGSMWRFFLQKKRERKGCGEAQIDQSAQWIRGKKISLLPGCWSCPGPSNFPKVMSVMF